jgi:hypothetical protein
VGYFSKHPPHPIQLHRQDLSRNRKTSKLPSFEIHKNTVDQNKQFPSDRKTDHLLGIHPATDLFVRKI